MNYANQIDFGDCRVTMRRWAAQGIKAQMCVTSPPYFGLRDYGHEGQIGLEQTPEQYIAAMVEVFRCVRDVLADDGTLWLNIGDSYATGTKADRQQSKNPGVGANRPEAQNSEARIGNPLGCKTKDLIGIPWMLAFALRADGGYLRQDIIWHKPNPMPESVRDRCTKAHEYIFLMSKSERYFFDSEAMREPAVKGPQRMQADPETARRRSVGPMARGEEGFNHQYADPERVWAADGKRNRRSVWTVTTRPYKGAHFATFPPALIEPCILAGTSEKGHCPECGARWERVVERTPMVIAKTDRNELRGTRTGTSGTMVEPARSKTTGWRPTCACRHEPVPDIVLDPFMGSGTTAAVALQHDRQYLGCELNSKYEALQQERIERVVVKS